MNKLIAIIILSTGLLFCQEELDKKIAVQDSIVRVLQNKVLETAYKTPNTQLEMIFHDNVVLLNYLIEEKKKLEKR